MTTKVISKLTILTITAVLTTACSIETQSSTEIQSDQANQFAEVVFITDGDTVRLNIDGVEESVRLIGIDTPEVRAGSEPIQCFGQEASDGLAALLPIGSQVEIQRDVEARDRFDRLLLYLFVGDTFINEELVRQGFAASRSFPPNTTRQDTLDAAQQDAIANNRGLWAVCDGPEQPLN